MGNEPRPNFPLMIMMRDGWFTESALAATLGRDCRNLYSSRSGLAE
jgi:hypothetical protein